MEPVNGINFVSEYVRVNAVNSSQLEQATVTYKEINGKQVSEVTVVLYNRYGVTQSHRASNVDVIA